MPSKQLAVSKSSQPSTMGSLGSSSRCLATTPNSSLRCQVNWLLQLRVTRDSLLGVKARANPEGKSKSHTPIVELDPNKLQILEGTFCCQDRALPQLRPQSSRSTQQWGHSDVSPRSGALSLRTGQQVSQEPLAMAVLVKSGGDITMALTHTPVTIPCRCTIDSEPVLADAVLVQLGTDMLRNLWVKR